MLGALFSAPCIYLYMYMYIYICVHRYTCVYLKTEVVNEVPVSIVVASTPKLYIPRPYWEAHGSSGTTNVLSSTCSQYMVVRFIVMGL